MQCHPEDITCLTLPAIRNVCGDATKPTTCQRLEEDLIHVISRGKKIVALAGRRANLQRLRPDDPLAALQLAVPDTLVPVIKQSAALQPIQETKALDIPPLAAALTARRNDGGGPLLAGVATAQLHGVHQAQLQPGKEHSLRLMPIDTGMGGIPPPEQQLPVNLIQSGQQGLAKHDREGMHAQPAAAKPQSDDGDTEHWQGSKLDLSKFPKAKPSTEQAAAHNDIAAAQNPVEEEHDPFAATFPTRLMAPTTKEEELDEWDTFQAPEEEAPQQQASNETDLLGAEGKLGQNRE